MIVAGLQTDIAWENPGENFRRVRTMTTALSSGPGARPHLLVLPEMFATGFSMEAEKMAAFADEIRRFLSTLARDFSVHVLAGYAEPAHPRPANACSIFDPAGEEVLHYRKLHPFSLAREDRHYLPGESLTTVQIEGVRVTPLICYDLRFPEPFRAAAAGTDLFCVIANWPAKRRHAWSTLLLARAIENQAYVLGVNRIGEGGGEPHSGDSALVDPLGVVIGGPEGTQGQVAHPARPEALPGTDRFHGSVVQGEVDPKEVTRVRRLFSFLKDRRQALYRRLDEERGVTRS